MDPKLVTPFCSLFLSPLRCTGACAVISLPAGHSVAHAMADRNSGIVGVLILFLARHEFVRRHDLRCRRRRCPGWFGLRHTKLRVRRRVSSTPRIPTSACLSRCSCSPVSSIASSLSSGRACGNSRPMRTIAATRRVRVTLAILVSPWRLHATIWQAGSAARRRRPRARTAPVMALILGEPLHPLLVEASLSQQRAQRRQQFRAADRISTVG